MTSIICNTNELIADAMMSAAKKLREPSGAKWTSLDDSRPADEQEVLLTNGKSVDIGYIRFGKWFAYKLHGSVPWSACYTSVPTYWMSLPKLPEVEG